MAAVNVSAEDMDSVNNNTMSNNNNSSNVNNNVVHQVPNAVLPGAAFGGGPADVVVPCSANNTNATAAAPPAANPPCVADATSTANNNNRSSRGGSSSRRGRSSGRSRSRRRHSHSSGRRGSRHHSRQSHNKRRERNFPSALCSMISIVILCTALAEPSWVRIDNGQCKQLASNAGRPPYALVTLKYLGALQFFYFGALVTDDPNVNHKDVTVVTEYSYGPENVDRLINCVTERVVMTFKIVIALTFLAIMTSLISFSLDLVGLQHRVFKSLRRSAIFNIFTVLVCVGITAFLYWATVDMVQLQMSPQLPGHDSMRVSFDVSFYLVTAAGACSVVGVACNCLRRKVLEGEASAVQTGRAILDDQFNEDTENLLAAIPPPHFRGLDLSPMADLPPPPPYTP